MHYSVPIVVVFSFLPALGLAIPAATSPKPAAAKSTGAATGTVVSDKQMMNAVMSWMNDTGKVSHFLDTATSFSGEMFTRQATIALNAEKDELNHKMVLDTALGSMDTIKAANDTLATQGTFQAVVDALQSMVDNGPDTAQMQVDAINQNRCVNVLPNINAYFAAAGAPDIQSVQPSGCLEVQGAVASPAASPAAGGDTTNGTDPAASAPPEATPAPSAKASAKAASSSSTSSSSASKAAPAGKATGTSSASKSSTSSAVKAKATV